MKKIIAIVVVLVIIILLVLKFSASPKAPEISTPFEESTTTVPTSQTVKVSEKLSEYKNDELGFTIKYPTIWERIDAPSNVTFDIPAASTAANKNTIGSMQAKVDIVSGKCSFPPVTTILERDTLKVGALSFNMISISNTLQGRNYFSRLYSLQKDSICYYFTYTSITLSPAAKGYVGADAQKVGAQNKTLVDTADSQFKDMVKSFAFIVGPVGKDEASVTPNK